MRLARAVRQELKEQVLHFLFRTGERPCVAVVLVGVRPESVRGGMNFSSSTLISMHAL